MKLHEQVKVLQETNKEVLADIQTFMEYLQSHKFTGTESDGARKDWISTGEVSNLLINLRSKLGNSISPFSR